MRALITSNRLVIAVIATPVAPADPTPLAVVVGVPQPATAAIPALAVQAAPASPTAPAPMEVTQGQQLAPAGQLAPATPVAAEEGAEAPPPCISAMSYIGQVGRAAVSRVLEGALRLAQRTGDRRVYVTEEDEEQPPMEVQQERPRPKSQSPPSSFRGLDLSLRDMTEVGVSLQNRGSHKYVLCERMLLIRLVVRHMETWLHALEHAEEHIDGLQSPHSPSSPVAKGSPRESLMIVQLIPRLGSEPSWTAACEVVAANSGVRLNNLRAWVMEYLWTGDLGGNLSSRKARLLLTGSSIPPAYVLEMLCVIHDRRIRGFVCNYSVLQAHLNSEERLHELCSVDVCPPLLVTSHAIGRALRRTGATAWAPTHRVGKLKEYDPATKQRRLMRLRVFHAEYCLARQKEEAGSVVLVQMDESFCNQFHFCEKGVVEVDAEGQVCAEVHGHKGKGVRLCLVGGVTMWGPLVCKDAEGQYVRDHRLQNARGEPVRTGGSFVELNQNNQPRAGYERRRAPARSPRLKDMKMEELVARAAVLQLDLADVVPRTKAYILNYLLLICGEAAKPRNDVQEAGGADADELGVGVGEDFSAEQVVLEDFPALRESLRDQARTTIKMFQANNPKGDYHKNFDTITFFKWMVSLVDTFPPWCEMMQRRLEAGELLPGTKPFFDWGRGQPARALVLSLDNAPYHKGIACQLSGKTKAEMAAILRHKKISYISFTATNEFGQPVRARAEVPARGKDWPVGWPNAEQVREGTYRALLAVDPQLVELPFEALIREVKDLWGPPGEDGFQMLWNAEYVSTEIYIEMFWGQGKNAVGNPKNQFAGRTLADISRILHETWFRDPDNLCERLQRHCEVVMSRFINIDHEQHGGPMHGQVPYVQGLPNAELLQEWKLQAGIKEGGVYEPFHDGEVGSDDEDEEGDASAGTVASHLRSTLCDVGAQSQPGSNDSSGGGVQVPNALEPDGPRVLDKHVHGCGG
ncbi:hypothetical protein B484DRAFT_434387 [Ochromonadaceae sp. CCMP2298]|nr:hypothetical protein B484DRAFT_434387 [Ochromonadaceae sp. CCMP2298]